MTALDDLTVTVPPGIVRPIGANGAGKSTLIKLALGPESVTCPSTSVCRRTSPPPSSIAVDRLRSLSLTSETP